MPKVPGLAPLDIALQLNAWGYAILPAPPQQKAPSIKWQNIKTPEQATGKTTLWFRNPANDFNYWAICGAAFGLLVLDCDNQHTVDWWHERVGALMDETRAVRTSKGAHFHFLIPTDKPIRGWSVHDGDLQFDIRANGQGVIMPPSVHESGFVYEWIRSPESALLLPAPDALLSKSVAAATGDDHVEPARSMLAQLLQNPPQGANSGRNDWLTRVAGHYAKQFHYAQDAYELHVRNANATLSDPLDDAEMQKVIDSIWNAEDAKPRTPALSEATGYLIAGDRCIMTVVQAKGQDPSLEPWSDFDARAIGVTQFGDQRTYDLELLLAGRDDVLKVEMPARILGVPSDLRRFLAGYDCSIMPPTNQVFHGSTPERFLRYLKAQEPPEYLALASLGWVDGIGFVTHEGLITPDGLVPLVGVVPAPILRNWAPYRYGFAGTKEEASALLAEIATFHDPGVVAVTGSWWAACFLKAQLMQKSSLFPFLGLEAPSESGKSTGFFASLVQLAGNTEGHGEWTIAYLRDRASAHRNGPVWVDDMSEPEPVLDLARQVTSEGSRGKKGEDRRTQETVRLHAPLIISGEGLSILNTEKALLDRAIRLHVPSPVIRRSLHDPTRPQWDDIKALRTRYSDDLTSRAGWMVQLALENATIVDQYEDLRSGTGRSADRYAILRVGARVFAAMTGHVCDWVIEEVDKWIAADDSSPIQHDNALTTEVLPTLLAQHGWPDKPTIHPHGNPASVWVEQESVVWFSTAYASEDWLRLRRGATTRLHTKSALDSQRVALGVEGGQSRRKWTIPHTNSGTKIWYWRLSDSDSAEVLRRSGLVISAQGRLVGPSQDQESDPS